MAYTVDVFVMCPRHQDPRKALDFGVQKFRNKSPTEQRVLCLLLGTPPAVQSKPSDLLTGSNFPVITV